MRVEWHDHNAVEAVAGEPAMVRSLTGTFETPVGKVVGVSAEHDAAAGSERGHNTVFVFALDGVRIAHFGDFGQAALRPEQREAIGEVDLPFVPVGGGPTIGGAVGGWAQRCKGSGAYSARKYCSASVLTQTPAAARALAWAASSRASGNGSSSGRAP